MPKRVLLIDDDERLVTALQMRLTAVGYEVFTARNGDLGISDAAILRPDAIVLDIRMPEMDGYQVCRLIREVPDLCKIPIVVLSATAGPEEIIEAGGDVFLRKPYQLRQLRCVLEQMMERACPPTSSSDSCNAA